MFNEISGCNNSSCGMARRLKSIEYLKVYNGDPNAFKNVMLINNDLPDLYDSAPYATTFLAYLIDTF
jgi:hypothetical protein